MAIKDLLTKPPFYRVANGFEEANKHAVPTYVDLMKYTERRIKGQVMTQADYLEEYYPFSHRIMSEFYFPEFYNYSEIRDEKTGEVTEEFHKEETFRIGTTIQSVITTQQLVHLTGNDIHFELTSPLVNYAYSEQLREAQEGWLVKGMESNFYEFARSVKMVADAAMVFYYSKNGPGVKVLSFTEGDSIFQHYDPITGEPNVFARRFSSYDEEGKETISWVEVWDDRYLRRYRQDKMGAKGVVNYIKEYLGLEGYTQVYEKEHGFSTLPVVYMRDKENGPCWNKVQWLSEDYEIALSYFAKNNAAAALPSYKLKGDNVDIKGDMLGRVRAFTMGKDDDVSLIQPNGLSENYTKYIEYLLNEIFSGAYIVKQPELKSGDTPTGTMKLYYAPSLDKATLEAKEYHPSIARMFRLFCEAYGLSVGKVTEYRRLADRVFGWIIPYVHENTSSLIADLVASKNAGILSVESATEHHPYAANNENSRITSELKQQQQADRLYQLMTSRRVSE